MKRFLIAILISIIFSMPSLAETITLKSGKTIEGELVEKTKEYVKISSGDREMKIKFKFMDKESAKRFKSMPVVIKEVSAEEKASIDASINAPKYDPNNPEGLSEIQFLLKARGYPEDSWPELERRMYIFFSQIDLASFMDKVEEAKKTPEGLRDFVSEMSESLVIQGYINFRQPPSLIRKLVNAFWDEDIEVVIGDNSISQEEKEEMKKGIFACSALTQLGAILFDILGIDSKIANSPEHAFNAIPLGRQMVLFADFSNQIFEIVDIGKWYRMNGKYWVLKEVHRINPIKKLEIESQWRQGESSLTAQKEILNVLFSYVKIANNNSATACIYNNRGHVYSGKGDFYQAIADHTQAIELDPNFALGYFNRGTAHIVNGDLTQALDDFNKAIELNPNEAEAYTNRGTIYQSKGELTQAFNDYNQAIVLNPNDAKSYNNRGTAHMVKEDLTQALDDFNKAIELNPNEAEAYINRGIVYSYNGNFSQAIADYSRAIELDQNYITAYENRAVSYYHQGNYSKAWDDVEKIRELGGKDNPELVEALQ